MVGNVSITQYDPGCLFLDWLNFLYLISGDKHWLAPYKTGVFDDEAYRALVSPNKAMGAAPEGAYFLKSLQRSANFTGHAINMGDEGATIGENVT